MYTHLNELLDTTDHIWWEAAGGAAGEVADTLTQLLHGLQDPLLHLQLKGEGGRERGREGKERRGK